MSKVKIFLILQFVFFVSLPVLAQVNPVWVSRYNGPGNGDDFAYALAVNNFGVFVTGTSHGGETSLDYTTIRYSPEGNILWVRNYNGPANGIDVAVDIAVDDSGNAYVTGYSEGIGSGKDYVTIKYAFDGTIRWVDRAGGPGDGEARALVVDTDGNVYVTGYITDFGADYATIKYRSDGVGLWGMNYNDPAVDGDDRARALAVDAAGNVYVTGVSTGLGTFLDYTTIKYNSVGDELWVKSYDGGGGASGDEATALALDASGNVYVTGRSYAAGTGNDYATIKYDPDGVQLWVNRYNGLGNGSDIAYDLEVDVGGNICVTGGSMGAGTDFDYATVKYSSLGVQLWARRYNGPGNGLDAANALAIDGSGNIYVTGNSTGAGTGNDYATVKYSSSGSQRWVGRYTGPAIGDDIATDVEVDSNGNVYVLGYSYNASGNFDFATAKVFTPENHFKTWRIQTQPIDTSVFTWDQFMQDTLRLDSIKFLSNPVQKVIQDDTFDIEKPDHHLNWYRAEGGVLPIHIGYVNQFESTSVEIDSVRYLLVPAQKLPHPAPESLDHYKCYRIKDTLEIFTQFQLKDQFDSLYRSNQFEFIGSMKRGFFCTPCRKNNEPMFDAVTHYVAYAFTPDVLPAPFIHETSDQFGTHLVQVFQSEMVLVPTLKFPCTRRAGDVDGNGNWTLTDIVGLVNIVFKGVPLPDPLCRGDANGDGKIDLSDIIYLVNKVFNSGPSPVKSGVCCK